MWVRKLNQIVDQRRRQRAMAYIRREFLDAGYPLDHFGDRQIEAALTRGHDDISSVNLSAKIIYHALKRLQPLGRKAPELTSNGERLAGGSVHPPPI